MPNWLQVVALGLAATAFFSVLGLPLARVVAVPGVAAIGIAPALGWAVFNALALPALSVVGFSEWPVRVLCLTAAVGALFIAQVWGRWPQRGSGQSPDLPSWCLMLAFAVALLPTVALLPKFVDGGVLLGPPMFDHVKIAIVDGILRDGLPVQNPFLGGAGPLAYYYLWHFSAAVLACGVGSGGWAADAAMTAFTAFASLMLMMGLAWAFGGRVVGCLAVAGLSLSGSLRPLRAVWRGSDAVDRVIPGNADLGGWLNQAAWVPQHLASACCVIVAALLMARLAEPQSTRWRGFVVATVLGLVVAAGFESSTWVGGVAFFVAGSWAGVRLLTSLRPGTRLPFVGGAVTAAVVAGVLIAPFVQAQFGAVAARQGGTPISIVPYGVFGAAVPPGWRSALDVPGFWLVLLVFEWPAIVPLGAAAIGLAVWRDKMGRLGGLVAEFAVACLAVASLFRSTIDNNDLGWRAVLPAVLLLTAFAAALLGRLAASWRADGIRAMGSRGLLILGCCLAALGLPDGARMLRSYGAGQRPGDAAGLAATPALWEAVRRQAGPNDRVASNPLLAAGATPWPVNISWAALSDRPSCYAGWETVLAYGALPKPVLDAMEARVTRVFGGTAGSDDVAALARADCRVAIVTPGDGAWTRDSFAASADYRLAEAVPGRWRIYKRREMPANLPQ